MKIVWMASLVAAAMSGAAWAQATIYKHVDESGRVTYTNKPMKGAVAVDLEPLTTIPATPMGALQSSPAAPAVAMPVKAVATLERVDRAEKPAAHAQPTLAAIEPQVQRRRDNDRKKILEEELAREEQSLTDARASISQEQQNPSLVAAVRAMQQAAEPSPSQLVEMRNNIEKASGRIRGLQSTVADHEKNIEALRKELAAIKP
ncbi:MAG TPA: DUF4124 domain-containing protein [Usitatibacter sp.]|nr:DUF4124 domain-containing protein [Usitatibacter sp.]